MTTIYDVAREANVSIATVSRVFNNNAKVSDNTRTKVKDAALRLNYSPHLGARSLMSRRTDSIGIVLPDMHGEFFSELIRGLDSATRKLGLHLLISCSHDDTEELNASISAMKGRVDGIVIMSPLISSHDFQKYIPEKIPVIVLNGPSEKAIYSAVSIDNYAGSYAMTEHLIAEGYQRITLITGAKNNSDSEQRIRGYVDAMKNKLPDSIIDIVEGDFSEESGYNAGMQILARPLMPEVVFASNDGMAIGCLCAFDEQNISVPKDIALAGFDDIPLSRYLRPALTTIKAPIAEFCSKAIEMLVAKIEKKDSDYTVEVVKFTPTLVIRDSSKKPPLSMK